MLIYNWFHTQLKLVHIAGEIFIAITFITEFWGNYNNRYIDNRQTKITFYLYFVNSSISVNKIQYSSNKFILKTNK